MPRYERYKDSGVDWIGIIPKHWRIEKLKYLFYEKAHQQNMSLNCGSISFGEVVEKDDENILESTKRSYQEVLAGEFLLNPLNLNYDLKSLRIALAKISVVVSAGYIVLKQKSGINKQYFKYLLHRFDVAHMKLMGAGVRQTINYGHIANSLLLLPSSQEQQAIAHFLDRKSAQIDQAIAIKQRQIALLKERKQIIIQNAVTKGLNPDAPMKASGVDWLGDIPAHWEMKPLKHLSQLNPKIEFRDSEPESAVCFLPMEKVTTEGEIICNILVPIKQVCRGFTGFNRGDVIIAKITPCFENGKSAYLNTLPTNVGFGSTEFHVLRCSKNILGEFLHLLISSHLFLKTGEAFMIGSAGQKRVPSSFIADFFVALPPLEEQKVIVEEIQKNNLKISRAIDLHQTQIQKLQEYKTTLINSLVTGKIKIAQESPVKNSPDKAFADAVIIAALVARFSDEKFQINRFRYTKFSYLLRRKLGHNVDNYQKKAAGPYDATIRYRGGERLAINKRYIKQIKDPYKGFISDQNIDEAQKHFHGWFDKKSLDWLEQFRYKNNDELGLITTIDKAMLEVRENSQPVTLQNIKQVLKSDNEWKNKLNQRIYSDNNIEITIKKLERLFGAQ